MNEKSHYSLEEAADLIHCKPRDLIHLAVQKKITLIVGVPDNVRFRTYDASADLIELPALLEPQLLALRQSHCLQIELNGKTEQCDFQEGFLINPAGTLQKLMPSYGRPRLNHLWAFWRTYDGQFSKNIELLPERLFVVGTELFNLIKSSKKIDLVKLENKKQIEKVSETSRQNSKNHPVESLEIVEINVPHANGAVTQKIEEKLSIKSAPTSIAAKPPTIIRLKTVQERTGLSRSTIYDKINRSSPRYDSTFPKQIRLGTGSVGWYESELIGWIESRKTISSL